MKSQQNELDVKIKLLTERGGLGSSGEWGGGDALTAGKRGGQ